MTAPDRAATIEAAVQTFAHDLVVGLVDAGLHGHRSEKHREQVRNVARGLRDAFVEGAAIPLRLAFDAATIRWQERDLVTASLQAGRLLRLAAERDIAAISFDTRTHPDSIAALLELLDDQKARDAFRPQSIDMVLRARGIRGIQIELGRPRAVETSHGGTSSVSDAMAEYQSLAGALQDSHVRAFRGVEIEIDQTRGVVERAVASMGDSPSELLALAAYDDIDRFTVGHSVRVALLALQVARAARASESELLLVGTSGLLHDIGKSLVPQEVLFKQGPLDDDEWAVMAEHPRLGAEILLEQKHVHPAAIGAAYCHHMAPSERGYPRPLTAFDPSGISKLVRICDVFEALTAIRPYKRELSPLEALAIMHREAKGFDPRWFRFFVQTIGIYPIGTRVLLDDGSRALVVRQGLALDRPVVKVIDPVSADDLPAAGSSEFTIGDAIDGEVRKVLDVVRRQPRDHAQETQGSAVFRHAATACVPPDGSAPHRH